MPHATTRRPARAPSRGRKNMRLDQDLLDTARRVLGATSETETVTLALQRIVHNARVAEGIRAIGGSGMFDESRIQD